MAGAALRAVLQLRLCDAIPKIHGLVVRTPRLGTAGSWRPSS
jgi:hypothetical protein